MKYFYIIERNGTITEVPYTEENYKKTFTEWVNGGRLIVKPKGHDIPTGINAVDVTKIADEEAYAAYINSATNLRRYIKNGVWYDAKEHKEIGLEKWQAIERADQKRLAAAPKEEISPEQAERNREHIARIGQALRNGFKMKT